jgi:putative transposase
LELAAVLLRVLEQVRRRYRFVVVGYVIMPEHVHLLFTEPERGNPSVMQAKARICPALPCAAAQESVLKQLSVWSGPVDCGRIWQPRFYDFVFSDKKRIQKLRYIPRNPVKRWMVLEPDQWAWSSYRHYVYGKAGLVLVNEPRRA